MYKGKKGVFQIVQMVLLCIVTVAAVWMAAFLFYINLPAAPLNTKESEEGANVLYALAQSDPSYVDTVLKERADARLEEERLEKIAEIESGEYDVFSYFKDYVVLGDSRAVGFSYYGFLTESRVLADGGWTIREIEGQIETIKALNPTMIFLCFGLNDVSIGYWHTPEEYAKEYKEVVELLNEELPNADVYISSILPAKDPAFERAESWREIPLYSAAVEKMCEEEGYNFVNNDNISEEYAYLWDEDGIHVQKEFYPYWALNMVLKIYGAS